MGGIREFNCACLIVSLVLALLPNTSSQFTLLRIIAWSSTSITFYVLKNIYCEENYFKKSYKIV
jgi:hypothetical protein